MNDRGLAITSALRRRLRHEERQARQCSTLLDLDHEQPGLDIIAAEDRAYRRAWGGAEGRPYGMVLKSAYCELLGSTPDLKPGDRDGARQYLQRVDLAIDQGGWTAGERTRLYRLRAKWQARALGKDARFEIAGTRGGRLTPDQEIAIRAATKRQRALDGKGSGGRSRARKHVDWSEYEDLDQPFGNAKGGPGLFDNAGNGTDPDGDIDDDEIGDGANLPQFDERRYLIPGQDQRGHSQRVQCRCMPAHYRALSIIYTSKKFPFRTLGDAVRWCIDNGIRELGRAQHVKGLSSVVGQVDAIREVLADELYHQDFAGIFDSLSTTVNRHMASNAQGEARRVVAIVKQQIEQMPEGYWREKYLTELSAQFGHLLTSDKDGGGVVRLR